MSKLRIIVNFVVIGMLLVMASSPSVAQGAPPVEQSKNLLNLSTEQITDDILIIFVDATFSKKLSLAEVRSFESKLTEAQRERTREIIALPLVAKILGVEPAKWRDLVLRDMRRGSTASPTAPASTMGYVGWEQGIPEAGWFGYWNVNANSYENTSAQAKVSLTTYIVGSIYLSRATRRDCVGIPLIPLSGSISG